MAWDGLICLSIAKFPCHQVVFIKPCAASSHRIAVKSSPKNLARVKGCGLKYYGYSLGMRCSASSSTWPHLAQGRGHADDTEVLPNLSIFGIDRKILLLLRDHFE